MPTAIHLQVSSVFAFKDVGWRVNVWLITVEIKDLFSRKGFSILSGSGQIWVVLWEILIGNEQQGKAKSVLQLSKPSVPWLAVSCPGFPLRLMQVASPLLAQSLATLPHSKTTKVMACHVSCLWYLRPPGRQKQRHRHYQALVVFLFGSFRWEFVNQIQTQRNWGPKQ